MITGMLQLFNDQELDRLQAGVFKVLENTGVSVHNDTFLSALSASSALTHQGRSTQVVKFPGHMVEELIAERRLQHWTPLREQGDLAPKEEIGLSGVIAPFFYDYDQKTRRYATRQDLINTIHWADVDLSPDREVGLAVTMSDVDARLEPVEAYALLLEHTRRPEGAYCLSADQIPFLMDLSAVYYGKPVFPRGPDFMTSPLTFGQRLAEHTLASIKFGNRHFAIGVMPISGGNAPMTLAGTVVMGVAESLGAALVIRSVVPDATFTFAPCNGIIDLRKGFAVFNAPEALLTDLGICELINRRFGGFASVAAHSDYIDAALPGIQAAYERAYRAMAIAAFVGDAFSLGGQGTLEAGQIFSPEQFILEREMSAGLWRLGRGIEVSDETLALDLIDSVGPGEHGSYLDKEHTLAHFRETWFPRYLQRGSYTGDAAESARDRQMLDMAHRHYQDTLAGYTPPVIDADKVKEIGRIVGKARQYLLD
jgi:trimethylamine--corrinoid protein Co-methyltransferase